MIPRISGNKLLNSISWLNHPYEFLDRALEQYGLTFTLNMPTLGNALVTGDPAYISEIIKNKHLIGGRGTRVLRPLLGDDSLIILEGHTHFSRRQILTPFFKTSYIRQFDSLTFTATLDAIEKLDKNACFSVFHTVRQITLKTIIRLIFGTMAQEKEKTLTQLVDAYCASFQNPLFLFLKILHFNLGKFSPWGRLQQNKKALYKFIMDEIEQRNAVPDLKPSNLLNELIFAAHQQKANLDNDSIFNEVLSLLLFGHDTNAVTMSWLFYHVYQNSDIHTKLKANTGNPQQVAEDLGPDNRNFLKACILESMRLCPVVVHLTRVAEQDTLLLERTVKSGDKILPCTYLAHHNPDIFNTPYAYKPQRFMSDKEYYHSFFPFGFGARKCIGEQLALRQMQIILSTFIRETHLELDANFKCNPERQLLLIGPTHGTMMRVV